MTINNANRPRHAAVVGLQWGDEGKGKVVDLLTAEHDVIVRYNGGANAGHTLVVDGEVYALHLIPSGILYPEKTCVVANGVVVDPVVMLEEIDALRDRGIEVGDNLRVSNRAHVVMPYHKAMDAAMEAHFEPEDGDGTGALGTTRRGIGPAYQDKAARSTAVRMGDLLDADRLRQRLRQICPLRAAQFRAIGRGDDSPDPDELTERYLAYGRRLQPFLVDTTYMLHDAIAAGQALLFEGANACLLDVDHGTFPYVTSSHCSALGIPSGTGLPMRNLDRVVGIMKAYSTRVGAGPMPTEQTSEIGDQIRERGREFGTTTGRPRRCGWLDLVAVRYSAMICGATSLACMLLDVLSGFDELKLCTAYRRADGTVTDRFSPDAHDLAGVTPVYETVTGWSEEIVETTERRDLPAAARAYLDKIEGVVGIPVELVSVGPERAQTLVTATG